MLSLLKKKQWKNTDRHEVVHLTLDNAKNIKLLRDNNITKENVLEAQAIKEGKIYSELSDSEIIQLEENVADGFETYNKNENSAKGIIKRFYKVFNKLIAGLKRFLNQTDAVDDFYDILQYGNDVSNEIYNIESNGKIASFVTDNVLKFSDTPALKDTTSTPEFKKFFEGSKVVNEDGSPMVVYHGTNSKFDTFDKDSVGKTDEGWFGRGFYFSNTNGEALSYGENLIPAYLNIKNPFIFYDYEYKRLIGTSYGNPFFMAELGKKFPKTAEKIKLDIVDRYEFDEKVDYRVPIRKEITLTEYIKQVEESNIEHSFDEVESEEGTRIDLVYTNKKGTKERIEVLGNRFDIREHKDLIKYFVFNEYNKLNVDLIDSLYGVERIFAEHSEFFTNEIKGTRI